MKAKTHKFKAHVWFLYSDKLHAWLSDKDTWTTIFWEARVFKSHREVRAAFLGELPDDHQYFDCEIFATEGLWIKPPGSMRRLNESRTPPEKPQQE